jgi:hypothetical protein
MKKYRAVKGDLVSIHGEKLNSLGLEKLHVYGDLLTLYNLPIQATIFETGHIYREIQTLELKLLTLYASYVLAHSGFNVENWASEDYWAGTGLEALYTTKFKDNDWIENLDLIEPADEDTEFCPEWEIYYKSAQQGRLKVVFSSMFIGEFDLHTGKTLDEVEHLLKKFDKACSNYVLVHPKISRKDKQSFMRSKEKMKQKIGENLILSTGEFVTKFIPNNERRKIIEDNWNSLREKIVENLRKKWPILIFATNAKELSEVDERIRNSRIKYETHSFEDAIKDAGVACESLLQILHSLYVSKKSAEEFEFYDLLCALKDVLTEEFGSNICQDLDFVRTWRNNVVHPGREKPDGAITLQVITRAELFNELFKKKIFERNLRPSGSS